MATTLQNALQIITNRMGLSANLTYVQSGLQVNMAVTSQIKAADLLSRVCSYVDHIYYVDNGTAVFIDKLPQGAATNATTSYPLTYTFTESDIVSDSLKAQRNAIYHTVATTVNELSVTTTPASGNLPAIDTNTITQKEYSLSTGQSAGTTLKFEALTHNQANDIQAILERKAAIVNLKTISVTIAGLQAINIGSRVQVTTPLNTADFRATSVSYNVTNNTVTVSGLGSYANV